MRQAIVDTGALVALLQRNDQYHQWADKQMARIAPPMLTCEAVLTEAYFLLRHLSGSHRALMELSRRSVLEVAFHFEDEKEAIGELMEKYADVPMSFADACLVRMSELDPQSFVFTTDSDFKIYRRHRQQIIPVMMPEDGS